MKKTTFIFCGISCAIAKTDPSNKTKVLNKDWDEIIQEVYDQVDDSKAFTAEALNIIVSLPTKDFLKCIVEEDEIENKYNRARAIWEYKVELASAIKGKRPTVGWSSGLDALRAGAIAEQFNY